MDVSEAVLRPLTDSSRLGDTLSAADCLDRVMKGAVHFCSAKLRTRLGDAAGDIVKGSCAVVFDREGSAVTFETRSPKHRGITEPGIEKTVKGAKDSFIEILRVNNALIRQKLQDPRLKLLGTVVGRRSLTDVTVAYVEGVTNPDFVREMLHRLDSIDIDGMLVTGDVEEYLTDSPRSPFPQLLYTERPDRFCSGLLDGRVGLLVSGLPLGFLAPASFSELMKGPDEKSQHFITATLLIFLRYAAMALSILLPAVYVAIAMYHQEMLPTKLLISVIDSKQNIPFSSATEVLGMLVAFELIQEAGLRLPDPVGETVSIIGALIVGQSAVAAKIISPVGVIVVALAGITGYTVPNQDLSSVFRLARLVFTLAAVLAGIFGVFIFLIFLIFHMCSLESFGVSYMSPLADFGHFSMLKTLIRIPLYKNKFRDPALRPLDRRRQG